MDIDLEDDDVTLALIPGLPSPQEYDEEFGPGIGRDVAKLAEHRGCEVVLPDEYEVQLDLDSDEDRALLDIQLQRFNDYEAQFRGPLAVITNEWRSRSGVGRHVIVRMPFAMEDDERVLWQALLGSDRKRELYNMLRILKEMQDPIALFRPKTAPASGESSGTSDRRV